LENRESVRQVPHRALRLIAARPAVFVRQGAVVAGWRREGGRRFGPYYHLTFRDAGRQQCIYLGRAGPLVEEVRHALAALRLPLVRRRAYRRLLREILGSLRADKALLHARLGALGLRLHGHEVRGWRRSPLRPRRGMW